MGFTHCIHTSGKGWKTEKSVLPACYKLHDRSWLFNEWGAHALSKEIGMCRASSAHRRETGSWGAWRVSKEQGAYQENRAAQDRSSCILQFPALI